MNKLHQSMEKDKEYGVSDEDISDENYIKNMNPSAIRKIFSKKSSMKSNPQDKNKHYVVIIGRDEYRFSTENEMRKFYINRIRSGNDKVTLTKYD